MPKILNNKITQLNIGDVQGILYNSFNLDLTTNPGKIGIGQRMLLTTDTITNMGVPIGFKYFDSHYFTIAGSRVFMNNGTPTGVFSEDTSTGAQTSFSSSYSDIDVFNNTLVVTTPAALYTKAANAGAGLGAYTLRRTFGAGTTPSRMLCNYFGREYWVEGRGQIFSMDTAFTTTTATGTAYTLKIPDGLDIMWMRPHSAGLYIGVMDIYGVQGAVFDWNGVKADTIRGTYPVGSQGALAGWVDNNILYVVTSDAKLKQFTGANFSPLGQLPIKSDILYKATNIILNDRFIHPNGLCAIDGRISMLINAKNNTSTDTQEPNIHSGIWEYYQENETLYHKHSLSYKPASGGSITDYGQMVVPMVGGIATVADIYETADSAKGNFLAGAAYYSDYSTIGYGIWTDDYYDLIEKSGFFATSQIKAQNIVETYNSITTIFNGTSGNKFIIKYRAKRIAPVDFQIRWESSTVFTTSQTGLEKGKEVTILNGKGAGRCAHIESVQTSNDSFVVTLDESIGFTGTAKARMENWKKLAPDITSSTLESGDSKISSPNTKIELKVSMQGTGRYVLIEEMVLDNTKNK